MAADKSHGSQSGRRRPPTIELEATEISNDPTDASQEPPAADASSARRRGWAPAWLPDLPLRLIGAGAVGAAAAVIAMLLVFWMAGMFGHQADPVVALGPRLGAIETQLRELAARPQPAAVDAKALDDLRARLAAFDPKALDELKARLAKLETAVATPHPPATDPALLSRVTATDDALKALTGHLEQLTRRTDAMAAQLAELQNAARAIGADRGEIAALANKIAALEQANQALREELAKRAVASLDDRAARLAMLAIALRDAVERGTPFAAELVAVKQLVSDASTLAALEPFAAQGVPTAAVLGRELAALIVPMRRAARTSSADSGFIGKLQANAEKLVRIHPVGEAPGADPAAILSRIEAKAAQADLGGALAELANLPDAARAPAQAWIARAQARQNAVATANGLVASATAALKAP